MPPRRVRRGFTLVELLVTVAIIAVLISVLLPALGNARRTAITVKCLSNLRSIELAHWMYMSENNGRMVQITHGLPGDPPPWMTTLSRQLGQELLQRSPVDRSPHWPLQLGGDNVPIPPSSDRFRSTSYAANWMLTPTGSQNRVRSLNDVPRPSVTVHFVLLAPEGESAGADHIHADAWAHPVPTASPALAAREVYIDAHGGKPKSADAVSNYGFLDGHAETLKFKDVYQSALLHRFDPRLAR
jgi:prepilin-type N-terminal cleavage/methylation domain-containing protein/prepilin-type processing-associated H-X9-DG protein